MVERKQVGVGVDGVRIEPETPRGRARDINRDREKGVEREAEADEGDQEGYEEEGE